jgi:hypothetical protein
LSDIHIADPFFVAPNATNATLLKFGLIFDDGTISSSPAYVGIEVKPQQSKNNNSSYVFPIILGIAIIALRWTEKVHICFDLL